MKLELEQIRRRAIELIKHPSMEDPTTLARLAPIPVKIQQLERQTQEIEDEVLRIKKLLDDCQNVSNQPNPRTSFNDDGKNSITPNGRRGQKKIRIEIDLSQLGLSGGKKIINEHKASDSLVSFLVFLYQEKGISTLEKLSGLSVNRSVFVSKDPKADYSYRSKGGDAEYQHQRISDSGYFVLTTSTTKEKVSDIRRAWQHLNYPTGALKVEEADKY